MADMETGIDPMVVVAEFERLLQHPFFRASERRPHLMKILLDAYLHGKRLTEIDVGLELNPRKPTVNVGDRARKVLSECRRHLAQEAEKPPVPGQQVSVRVSERGFSLDVQPISWEVPTGQLPNPHLHVVRGSVSRAPQSMEDQPGERLSVEPGPGETHRPFVRHVLRWAALGGMLGGLGASVVYRYVLPMTERILTMPTGGATRPGGPPNREMFAALVGGMLGGIIMDFFSRKVRDERATIAKCGLVSIMFLLGGGILVAVHVYSEDSKSIADYLGFFLHGGVASSLVVYLVDFRGLTRNGAILGCLVPSVCGVLAYTSISVLGILNLVTMMHPYWGIMLLPCTIVYLGTIYFVMILGQIKDWTL